MKPILIRKIGRLLVQGITTEAETVYLLSEIRKLLEHDGIGRERYILKFWCDWCFHTRLQNPYAQQIISFFDKTSALHAQGLTIDQLPAPIRQELEELIWMRSFRLELHRLFKELSLHTHLTSDEGQWMAFMRLYCLVIEQCPLTIFSNNETSRIKSVEVGVQQISKTWYELRWALLDRKDLYNVYSQILF